MTSVVRFEEWQEPTGTTAATVDGSGNVAFSGTITQGGVLMPSAAELNALNNVTSLYASTTSVPTNTPTPLEFTSPSQVVVDVSNWHSTTTNPSRITVDRAGVYLVGGGLQYNYNSSSARFFMNISRSGALLLDVGQFSPYFPGLSISGVFTANAGDYFQLIAYQESGSTIGLFGGRNVFYCQLLRTL